MSDNGKTSRRDLAEDVGPLRHGGDRLRGIPRHVGFNSRVGRLHFRNLANRGLTPADFGIVEPRNRGFSKDRRGS